MADQQQPVHGMNQPANEQDPFDDEATIDPEDDQYGNLDEPEMDLYGMMEEPNTPQASSLDDPLADPSLSGSPDDLDTAGGLGVYDDHSDFSEDHTPIQPGSDRDTHRTKGSQDQYGYQQSVE